MKKYIIIALAVLGIAACQTQFDALLSSNDVDAKYEAAMNYFNNRKYQKAGQLFESLAILTSGTARDDTVQCREKMRLGWDSFCKALTDFALTLEK